MLPLRTLGDRLSRDGSNPFISGALPDRQNAYGTALLASATAVMEALARGLTPELAPIRVDVLSPGMIDTASHAIVFLMQNGWMNGATLILGGGSRLV